MDLKTSLAFKKKTMKELADYCGVSAMHISSVANGRFYPSDKLAKKIEEFLEGTITVQKLREGAKVTQYICPTCGKRRRCVKAMKQIDIFKKVKK